MIVNRKKLIVVVGPTAVGKTAMAIQLARYFKTEILSADSRQFYKEMSIGTAKPAKEELQQAKHHFIDSHSIAIEYSAGDYERDALALLQNLFEKQDTVIMVGGSGLFVRAVCEGLDDLPRAPSEVRERLNNLYEEQGIAVLQEKLRLLDPAYFDRADVHNPQRVIRALEVIEASGLPFSSFRGKVQNLRPFDVITIGLNMERAQLYERINERVEGMMADGLLDEVRTLLDYRDKPALLTVGYAVLFAHLDGEITLDEAVARIKQNSRRYAKRQITWFKKYGNTQWFTPLEWERLLAYIEEK